MSGARSSSRARSCASTACVALVLALLLHSEASAEEVALRSQADAWTFMEAWRTFRYDVDSTLPGGHGDVLLIEGLHDEPPWLLRTGLRLARNPDVLDILARRAARRDDADAIPALLRALESTPSSTSRRVLERALVRLGDDATLKTLSGRLRSGSPKTRREAAASLGYAGEKGLPTLRAALDDRDIQTRLAAAAALAGQGDRRARKLLGDLLTSTVPYHQIEAAHALAQTGDRRALPLLREALDRQSPDRLRVVRSLGFVGGTRERDLLVKTWRDLPRSRAKAMRREILLALGRIATKTELTKAPALLESLDEEPDDDSGVRGAWLEAIGWADARGARDPAAFVVKIRASLESAFPGETPVAHQLRQQRVGRLLASLTGATIPHHKETGSPSRATLEKWLSARNPDDDKARILRFRAAVTLLTDLGADLGYDKLADPPHVHPVGLNADRAVDGNLVTSWIAGKMSGSLRLDLPSPARLKALHLVNGCVDSQSSFKTHARIKTLIVSLGEGGEVEANLNDGTPAFQRVALPGKTTNHVSLQVTATYPGSAADAPACIAEVRLE